MKTTKIVPVDISLQEYVAIKINQYEHQSREFYFELYDNNSRYIIPENAVARVKMRNSKGINMLYDCDIFNNMCHIIFDDMVSATSGKTKAQLILTDNITGSILATVPFYLYVIGSVYGEEVLSTQPYKSLEDALLRYDTDIAEIERHEETTKGYMQEADRDAGLAKSYAVGDDDVRPGSSTDNAKYYKEQSKIFEKEIKDTVRTNLVKLMFRNKEQIKNNVHCTFHENGNVYIRGWSPETETTFQITEKTYLKNSRGKTYKICAKPSYVNLPPDGVCYCMVKLEKKENNNVAKIIKFNNIDEFIFNGDTYNTFTMYIVMGKYQTAYYDDEARISFWPMITTDLTASVDDFVLYSGDCDLNQNVAEIYRNFEEDIGDTDISLIGDGTIKGAISQTSSQLSQKTHWGTYYLALGGNYVTLPDLELIEEAHIVIYLDTKNKKFSNSGNKLVLNLTNYDLMYNSTDTYYNVGYYAGDTDYCKAKILINSNGITLDSCFYNSSTDISNDIYIGVAFR